MADLYTVSDIGRRVKIICGNHAKDVEPIEMIVGEGRFGGFWSCPKYNAENRCEHEAPCFNRFNFLDYEKLLGYISKLYIEAEANGEQLLNLTGTRWTVKGIDYEIIRDDKDGLLVSVINKPSLQGVKHYY